MIYFSVTCFAPLSKRLIISIPLFLGVLLLGANRVEAVVENCGRVLPYGGNCSCDEDASAGTKVLLNCDNVSAGQTGTLFLYEEGLTRIQSGSFNHLTMITAL